MSGSRPLALEGVAVLGPPADVRALAVAAAAALGSPAVVCWPGEAPGGGGGATRAAAALARRLGDHGHDAVARGLVVHVALPRADAEAAVALRRVLGTTAPVVLALDGPRGEAVDVALADLDRAILVGAEALHAGLADLSVAALAGRLPPRTTPLRATSLDRWLARAGWARPSTRRRLREALLGAS